MPPDMNFHADLKTAASFRQARAALDGDQEVVLLDFLLLDCDPPPMPVTLKCSLDNTRKLVRTCLAVLAYFGDQPASVLLRLLREHDQ